MLVALVLLLGDALLNPFLASFLVTLNLKNRHICDNRFPVSFLSGFQQDGVGPEMLINLSANLELELLKH